MTECFISLLSTFFSLSEDISTQSPSIPLPIWIPSYCNSITDAHFLSNILSIISETSNDMNQVISEVSQSGETTGLKSLLENMRWKFGDLLSKVWRNGKHLIIDDVGSIINAVSIQMPKSSTALRIGSLIINLIRKENLSQSQRTWPLLNHSSGTSRLWRSKLLEALK
jgi:hypothetical protein